MTARIICGFPGIGKSHFKRVAKGVTVADSDSSKFSWIRPGERHPDFPANYIAHIIAASAVFDIILVSTHKDVRDALVDAGLEFDLAYPEREAKDEYLKRYRDRGSDDAFVALLDENWDAWIEELEQQPGCGKHLVMCGNWFLSDVL